jgi:general stress protein YciG
MLQPALQAALFFQNSSICKHKNPLNFMIENFTNQPEAAKKSGKSRRGFASMDKDRHKLVSSKGGKSIRTHYTSRLSATPDTNTPPVN